MSMTSQSGRKLYVDNDIDCVCIEFDYWGETKTLQVPFAKYRPSNEFKFGTYGLDVVELDNFSSASGNLYVSDSYINEKVTMPITTDKDLQSRLEYYRSDKSGRENTDIWMKYTDYIDSYGIIGLPAVQACRNTSTKGIATAGYFDCPNVYELTIAFIESDNIDMLDPTAESYPDKKLGKTNPKGRFKNSYTWTSTKCSATFVRYVNADGYVCTTNKANASYVLPCKIKPTKCCTQCSKKIRKQHILSVSLYIKGISPIDRCLGLKESLELINKLTWSTDAVLGLEKFNIIDIDEDTENMTVIFSIKISDNVNLVEETVGKILKSDLVSSTYKIYVKEV